MVRREDTTAHFLAPDPMRSTDPIPPSSGPPVARGAGGARELQVRWQAWHGAMAHGARHGSPSVSLEVFSHAMHRNSPELLEPRRASRVICSPLIPC